MKKGWEIAYVTQDLYRAEIGATILEDAGINCVVINKKDSAYGTFGEIELYVKREDVLQAINMINKAFDE